MHDDNADALLTIPARKGSTNLVSFTYKRNGAQQVATSTTTGIAKPANAYNTLGQLTKSGPSTAQVAYAYDAADRLTGRNSTTTQAYDAASELCWSKTAAVANPSCSTIPTGATRYTHDARGNRTAKTPSTGAATTYSYNQNNQMTAVSGAATYAYDADGLRMSKTLTGKPATRMIWDRSQAIPNLMGDGANTYIYGPDGTPLEQISSAGAVSYLHHDQLGSTRLITSSTGAKVATYNFDPYGAQTAKTGTATTPLGYAGQYKDAESGLIYMRARYYDPASGVFTSADPIGSLGSGQNLYGYVGGDPLNFV
ncbi:MAG: RHS repeat-associated core domain-containing protein, partial [Thermoleophilaceae bacterium]|nr:RHS repeat-associated core domain-containing protein [Thermoleophilaceae bacterium]